MANENKAGIPDAQALARCCRAFTRSQEFKLDRVGIYLVGEPSVYNDLDFACSPGADQ